MSSKNRAHPNQNSMIYGTTSGPKYKSLPAQVRDPITGKISFKSNLKGYAKALYK